MGMLRRVKPIQLADLYNGFGDHEHHAEAEANSAPAGVNENDFNKNNRSTS